MNPPPTLPALVRLAASTLVLALAGCPDSETPSTADAAETSTAPDAADGAGTPDGVADTATPPDIGAETSPDATPDPGPGDADAAAPDAMVADAEPDMTITPDAATTDTGPDVPAPAPATWDPADFTTVYDVGPGHPYADPSEVPWESIGPSTLVRIHWRAEPYRDKWVINTEATETEPVVVLGVPSGSGALPVISGDGAKTRQALSYWNERRSIIKVGGSNLPSDTNVPSWVYIEGLHIENAQPAYSFTDDGGSGDTYAGNAAAIHVEVGDHITVRGCVLRDAGNGLFSGSGSSNLALIGNHLYDNGIEDSIYEHNSYTESFGILFEGNYYGPLRAGCLGNNLKDRSAGTVIRYNWIESGNRQLDLVETDYTDFSSDPSYATTYVYGNVLVEPEGAGNRQIVHFGGDGGDTAMYRGTLFMFHNTIVSTRSGNNTVVRLSTQSQSADIRNNIIYTLPNSGTLEVTTGTGTVDLAYNWIREGWVTAISPDGAVVNAVGNIDAAGEPGFADFDNGDYALASGSACIDAGDTAGMPLPVMYEPAKPGVSPRPDDGAADMGALEAQ